MKGIFKHLNRYSIRGILALIPFAITFFTLRLLHLGIEKHATGFITNFIGFTVPGLGIILLFLVLYTVGITSSNMAGRYLFNVIERITHRIPFINTTYRVGRQLSEALSLPERHVFRRAVPIHYLKPEIRAVGFATGSLIDRENNNEKLLKVFVPTSPNPLTGTIVITRESDVRDPHWKVEEAIRAVISGGVIGPSEIG